MQLSAELLGLYGFNLQRYDFQRMAHYLHGQCSSICQTLEECQEQTKRVLERMQEEDLHLKLAKCTFDQKEVEYLGLVVKGGGSTHGPHQVEGCGAMGTAHVSKSSQILHCILQFLPEIHP